MATSAGAASSVWKPAVEDIAEKNVVHARGSEVVTDTTPANLVWANRNNKTEYDLISVDVANVVQELVFNYGYTNEQIALILTTELLTGQTGSNQHINQILIYGSGWGTSKDPELLINYTEAPTPTGGADLHYRKNNSNTAITLYSNTTNMTNYMQVRVGGATVYAALDTTGHSNASDLRIQKGGTTYAVLTEWWTS